MVWNTLLAPPMILRDILLNLNIGKRHYRSIGLPRIP